MAENSASIEQPNMHYFQKLWAYRQYLTVEPFFFFYVMASVFNAVAIQNFPLDKACRVNFKYSKTVCDATLDKATYGIDCDNYDFDNVTEIDDPGLLNLTIHSPEFSYIVCKAESKAQKLASDVSGIRAPAAAVFPLIVLLFAGGWADRYNKRKPCMVLPIVGEMLSFACLLVSAIFFDELPMEFGAYLEAIVPALFGGTTLCLMAAYSYMTIATPEPDRIFRFGIFAMFVTIIPFIGQPISGWLFKELGYKFSFSFALVFQIIAILYIIFYIKEVKPSDVKDKTETAETSTNTNAAPPALPRQAPPAKNGTENLAYEQTQLDEVNPYKNVSFEMTSVHQEGQRHEPPKEVVEPVKLPLWRELFDYTLLKDFIKFPFVRRKNRARLLLNLLLAAYFLTLGPVAGENDYWYRFTLRKLGWNGSDFSYYLTFTSGMAVLGTFIGTAVLSKIFKFADSTIGMLSALSIVLSRIIYAFCEDSTAFYAAGVVDMLVSLRVIAIKSIGSSIVAGDELSKMYSVFGISEPIGQFIFPPLYTAIYTSTVDHFPGAIFLFGEIFYVPNVLVFVLCYFILRRRKSTTDKDAVENGQNGSTAKPDSEVTSL